jgi:hypothetical protein
MSPGGAFDESDARRYAKTMAMQIAKPAPFDLKQGPQCSASQSCKNSCRSKFAPSKRSQSIERTE